MARASAGGYWPSDLRLGESLVPVFVEQRGRRLVIRRATDGATRLHGVDGADRRPLGVGAQRIDGRAMGQVHVMNGLVQGRRIGEARRMPGEAIAEQREQRRFVEGGEAPDAVAEAARNQCRIVGEPAGDVAVEPAAVVLQGLRQVPVVKAEPGLDACRQKPVDQPIVEGQARPRWPRRVRPAARAARPRKIDRPRRRARASGQCLRRNGDSDRTRHRRCRRWRCDRAPGNRHPRCRVPCRRRWPRPRSGSSTSRRPRRSCAATTGVWLYLAERAALRRLVAAGLSRFGSPLRR